MNFINDKELARRMRDGNIKSSERFYYFLIFMVGITIFMMNSTNSVMYNGEYNKWDIALDKLAFLATIIGSIILYKTNKRGDDKEFIERYICLGFPVAMQMLGISLALFATYILLSEIQVIEMPEETTVVDYLLTLIVELYFYIRLNKAMKIASGQEG